MSADPQPAISAVVLTKDEEAHLGDCLRSLAWVDELLVLDSGSRDGTLRIARAAGARIEHRDFQNFSRQRQHGLTLASAPWVLFVDADERVPAELRDEILALLASGPVAAGYWIPRRNDFWGHRLRGGGWWPDRQLRLLRRDRARYAPTRAVHELAEVDGETGTLHAPLLHLNYASFAEFRAKQADYAHLEARRRADEGWPLRRRQLLGQPLRELYRRFIRLGGWRDGPTGLLLCAWMAVAEWQALRELGRLQREERA